MGVMENMRNSTPIVLWVLIISFGVLWVLQDTQVFDVIGAGPQSLGEVNGDRISYEEYSQRVSFYSDQYSEQTGTSMSPEVRAIYENQAWDDLVVARLIEQKMNELGITVTDAEIIEAITGPNPDQFVRQYFTAEDGTIDRIALRAAIEAPENSEIWIMVEQQLRQQRRQQKMMNYIMTGMRVSALEIEQEYIRSNSFADIRYVRFPYSEITDEEIQVTDTELRNYYNNNRDQYTRNESYRFRYVLFDKTPTQDDTLRAVRDVEELIERFREAENDSLFLVRNQSAVPYRGAFVNVNDIRDEFRPVTDLSVGEVSELIMINGNPHVFKKIDQRGNDIKFGVLSYTVVADPIATLDRLAETAGDFKFYAEEDGFAEEAERRGLTVNEAFATKGNPFIPGIGQSLQLLNAFERLNRNRISEPVETEQYFVVAQMLEKTPEGTRPFEEVRAQVENVVRAQKRKGIMAERVSAMMTSGMSLDELSASSGKSVERAANIRKSGTTIPGAGREPGVIGSIFSLTAGQTSGVISGTNAAFVIMVDDITLADPSTMTAANRNEIRERLEQRKFNAFNEVWIEELKAKANIKDNRSFLLR